MRDGYIEEKLPRQIKEIFDRFYAFGEEAYVVGGSLRDIMRGETPNDFDLTSSSVPERTKEIFRGFRVIETGIKHGTVTVIYEGEPIEITTFRIDGDYTDCRHPDSVRFTSKIEEDLSRRDFTVNDMAYNDRRGLVDPFGGRADLAGGVIRAVGDSRRRFSEDALRIMRAFRFSAVLGFTVDEGTLLGAEECMGGLSAVARERIGVEFVKLIVAKAPESALKLMKKSGALPHIFGKSEPREELFSLLSKMPQRDTARLGLLLSETEEAEARQILQGLRLSGAQIKGALAVARGARESVETPKEARAFIGRCGIYAEDGVCASVLLGNSPPKAFDLVAGNKAPCRLCDLAISGRELVGLGFSGREVGRVLDRLLSEVLAEPAYNEREILLDMAKNYLTEEGQK